MASTSSSSYPQQYNQAIRLPYLRKPSIPSTYHEALGLAVESFKDIKNKIDWVFDIAGYQSSVRPCQQKSKSDEENLKSKRNLYQWETCGNFPPHLKNLPVPDRAEQLFIFDFKRMYDTLQAAFPLVPDVDFFENLAPSAEGATMKYLENRNRFLHNWTSHNISSSQE
ncbi:hypothetical protein NLJ89_g9905 [Agrocybe chaxingu]|uniref:Uncharacterized protein n=1 Tax=Agrocybe chaxingu TaxID=84603 RepID=A0A9W8MSM1_9AGAR|nr:hypothetical protein NLJ89_g9905 [Agrocybe chaxingu]